jgi:hypothetical protein
MRLRGVRNRFLSRSVATLLAVLVCGSAVGWGHVGGDDRDCDIVVVNHHDHNAHRFSTAPANSPSSGDHCYICHSLRLLHHVVTGRYERVAVALQAVHRLDCDVLAIREGLHVGIASRAPPSVRL